MNKKKLIDYKNKYNSLLADYEVLEKKLAEVKTSQPERKNDNLSTENKMLHLKSDLEKKNEVISDLESENKNSKNQIEILKNEFSNQRNETTKKAEKLTEFQQRIFYLEQENIVIRRLT